MAVWESISMAGWESVSMAGWESVSMAGWWCQLVWRGGGVS